MGLTGKLALVVIAISSTAIAAVLITDEVADAQTTLSDVELVWCDANRHLVGLAAETLDLLPQTLAERPINLTSDDPDDPSVELGDLSVLAALRRFRAVAQDVPPELFADIGYPTRATFERWGVLGPRALHGSALVVGEWLGELEGGWDHLDASRACRAAVSAFR